MAAPDNSPGVSAATPRAPPISLPHFSTDVRDVFSLRYNRISFMFEHDFAGNPLFDWPNLLDLAQRHPADPAHTYWSNGKVDVHDCWDAAGACRYSLSETLVHIADNDSLAMLKHLEEDAIYGPFVRKVQQEVLELVGAQMQADVLCGRGTLLIASPWRITSYHIDSDVNFLFQITGNKLFQVFDPSYATLTANEELENYFLGDANGAVFKPERQVESTSYDLQAGRGVHVPCITPHWAKNLDAPSVALSINFDLRSMKSIGRLYRLNGRLRRLGLQPVAPGVSGWRDALKRTALGFLRPQSHP